MWYSATKVPLTFTQKIELTHTYGLVPPRYPCRSPKKLTYTYDAVPPSYLCRLCLWCSDTYVVHRALRTKNVHSDENVMLPRADAINAISCVVFHKWVIDYRRRTRLQLHYLCTYLLTCSLPVCLSWTETEIILVSVTVSS